MLPYLLSFCRMTIGVTFAYSFLAKVQDVNRFARIIANFKLLPGRLNKPATILLLVGELTIILLIMVGGQWLSIGFSLAIVLLLVFTTTLARTLTKNMQTPCNCFGAGEQSVTAYDLWRNGGFILCAAGGWIISHLGDVRPLNWLEWSVIVVPALVFVVLMTHLNKIATLFWPVGEK